MIFIKKTDEYYMKIALEEAQKAYDLNEIPVGCIIVENGTIIAKAHNLKEQMMKVTGHAELIAIEKASAINSNWRLDEATLYVTLEPCPMCAGAIVQSRIKRVVFGALDNKTGAVVSSKHIFENNHNHSMLVTSRILEEECESIIQQFLNTRRNSGGI